MLGLVKRCGNLANLSCLFLFCNVSDSLCPSHSLHQNLQIFWREIQGAALFRKSSDNFTNNVWISSSIMDSLDINIFDWNWHCSRPQCQRSSERRIWPWNFKPIVSMSCNTVFTLQHPKKILFDLKRREVPNLAAGWCDGDGSQAENYFESVDLNFKSGTAGWTHTKVYIMWFYVVVMG